MSDIVYNFNSMMPKNVLTIRELIELQSHEITRRVSKRIVYPKETNLIKYSNYQTLWTI